ncbi:MAG: hypothetical protein WKG01_00650 [Kofleriaceae bacterium]
MRARLLGLLTLFSGCVDPFDGRDRPPFEPADPTDRPDAGTRPDPPPRPDAPRPEAAKRVFVTSLLYPAAFQRTIPAATPHRAADAICQSLSDAAQLRGTFRAWLSTSTIAAIDHIETNGPWYRLDGELAFSNHVALQAHPQVAISIDERGEPITGTTLTWTGTAIGGLASTSTCNDWSATTDVTSTMGLASVTNDWTARSRTSCAGEFHLYCFEQ